MNVSFKYSIMKNRFTWIDVLKMNSLKNRYLAILLLGSISLMAQVPGPVLEYPNKVLILGGIAHIGNGEVIENSAVSINNGLFTFVKNQMRKRVSIADYDTVIYLNGEHIYPGFIVTDNTLGITEIDALRQSRDYDEVGKFNPNLKTAVAYNPESKIVHTVRSNGILTTQVTPRGGIISGASSVMKLDAWNYEDATIRKVDGFHLNWPNRFSQSGPWYAAGPLKKSKTSVDKIEEIVHYFQSAKAYSQTGNAEVNIEFESLRSLFRGQTTLYVHCDMSKEIMQVIQFKKKLGIEKVVIVGGYDAGMLTNELKESSIGIILRRVHSLPLRQDDDSRYAYKLPMVLQSAGVLYCLGTSGDMEAMNARNLPFLAGEAVGFGLTKEQALESITLSAAKILGIDKKLGSLESGKQATFFISTGDALDMRTNNVTRAWIQGRPLVLDNTQKQLYQKYMRKYRFEKK
ncbi:MAG: imidazolonepropionase-like amidohydrolase [Salibacteraceae bacterium]|jgi:imidazolonepropionase-like amidohydrolase